MNVQSQPVPTVSKDILQKYANCMEEIKNRTRALIQFWQSDIGQIPIMVAVESMCLQIRMILELIALASLVANKTEYEKHRKNFRRDWKAKAILETLDKTNPEFYPYPIKLVTDRKTGRKNKMMPVKSGYLSRKDFEDLYDQCGSLLHATNPFSSGREEKITSFANNIAEWANKIQKLLHYHHVQLIDEKERILVGMTGGEDGKARVMVILRQD